MKKNRIAYLGNFAIDLEQVQAIEVLLFSSCVFLKGRADPISITHSQGDGDELAEAWRGYIKDKEKQCED